MIDVVEFSREECDDGDINSDNIFVHGKDLSVCPYTCLSINFILVLSMYMPCPKSSNY